MIEPGKPATSTSSTPTDYEPTHPAPANILSVDGSIVITGGECPICGKAISPGLLMCLDHWRAVPNVLKTEVGRAWRRFQTQTSHTLASNQGAGYRAILRDELTRLREVQRRACAAVLQSLGAAR